MKADKPKPMFRVLGEPMLEWVISACEKAGVDDICIVKGYKSEIIDEYIGNRYKTALQSQRLGTGHAVMQSVPFLEESQSENTLVLCGDAPFIDSETIKRSLDEHIKSGNAVTVISACLDNPCGYGRIVQSENGISAIVEQKDASEEQLKIREINSGCYWFDTKQLILALSKLECNNAANEYYLNTQNIAPACIGTNEDCKKLKSLKDKLGNHISSDTLKASAIDSIGDVVATSAVVVGMVLTKYSSLPFDIDAVVGILVAIYIIIMGIKLVIESSSTLIGKAPDPEFTHNIIEKIKSYEGVLGIHDLVIHSYGANRYFATVHVEIDADANVMHSHDLMDVIEADFLKDGINLVIHMDPISVSDPETNDARNRCLLIIASLSAEYSQPMSMHDFRIVKGVTHTNVIFDVSVTDEFPLKNKEICNVLTEKIKEINPLYNLVLTIDRDYFSERYGE